MTGTYYSGLQRSVLIHVLLGFQTEMRAVGGGVIFNNYEQIILKEKFNKLMKDKTATPVMFQVDKDYICLNRRRGEIVTFSLFSLLKIILKIKCMDNIAALQ